VFTLLGDIRKAGIYCLALIMVVLFPTTLLSSDLPIPSSLQDSSSTHLQAIKRPVVGLALSGGGAKGLAHVGVLKVLEEAGLEIDVVSGTSMGAIVGGLYSIGYSVAELESLATSTDWIDIMDDDPGRRELSVEQKQYDGRYSLSLPLSGWNVALPSGVISGQKIGKLLVGLTWPVHHVSNFRELPRSFSCVATDIQTGEAVVIDEGFLPEAMRASFSIPSIMTPVKMDDRLLIDGFVARNLPAEDAMDLGADFIIGVDVGRDPLQPDQINSFIDVLNQTMSIQGEKANVEQRKLCDILISPKLEDMEFLDFSNVQEFILRGEEATRKILPQLKAFADSINKLDRENYIYYPIAGDSVRILSVEIEGLEKSNETLIYGLLDFDVPEMVSKKELELNIDRIYSTLFFERVTYKTLPQPGGVTLKINVVEKEADQLRFGFHYDTEDKTAVLLNATLYNRLWRNSMLVFDLRLGNSMGSILNYVKYIGVKPRVGFGLSVSSFKNEQMLSAKVLDPNADDLYRIPYTNTHDLFDMTFATTISTRSLIGLGFDIETIGFSVDNVTEEQSEILNRSYDSVHGYIIWIYDSLNRSVFPTQGLTAEVLVKQGFDFDDQDADAVSVVYDREFRFQGIMKLNEKWVIQNALFVGYHDEGGIPFPKYNYGGVDSFFGMKNGEISGDQTFVMRIALQWEPWKRKYISIGSDFGMAGSKIELEHEKFENGFGVTLGMLSPFGPIQWTTHSGTGNGAGTNIRIGYMF